MSTAKKIRAKLEDNIKLETDYQDLIKIETKHGHQLLSEKEKGKLNAIIAIFKTIERGGRREAEQCLPQQSNLENWSEKYGTRTKKASVIMRDYEKLSGNKILQKRDEEEQEEEKERKKLEKSKKRK